MKRALAERAKQSLNAAVTNAKQQHEINNNHRIPQLPPMATSTYTTHSAESSFSSLPNNSKLLQSETQNESSRGSPTGQRRNDEIAAGSESPFNERPWKIPRLEKILKEEETLNNATTNSYSPRIIVNKEAIFSKSSSGGGILNHTSQPPPLKRRFSMEHLPPPQQMASSSEVAKVATTTTSISSKPKRTENDNVAVAEEDTNSAFYLKHQNRALATELKSLQFAVSQLEEEREARRQHCYATLQAVNELQAVWRAMEEETAIAMPPTAAFTPSSMDSSQDPPSTGTGDSVEWTRALQNALVALGQPRAPPFQTNEFQHAPQQPESSSCNNTDRMEQAVINIAARAKVLQEWLGTLLRSKSIPTTSHQQECLSAEQRLHNLQSEMAVVMARCTELEAQVLELAASRQEVVSRERRVRRNIYRMAAEMLSPEQVVNLLEQGGEDEELEAAVHLEKQQMKSEQNDKADAAAIALKQEDISEGKLSTDRVLSAQVDDFRAKICNLEESLASANKSIQDLNTQLIEKERRITELSSRQLSDEDASKLEALQSTLLQLKTSQTSVAELQSKLSKTEEKWSQALGNEKAALAAVDELISKFNKRWYEFTHHSASTDNNTAGGDTEGSNGKAIAPLPEDNPQVVMSKQIAELKHKLNQALENVRQSETTRENLKVALTMNGSLQLKLDEVRAKYAAVQAARSSSNPSNHRPPAQGSSQSNAAAEGVVSSSTLKEKCTSEQAKPNAESSGTSSRSEKLHRDYRRARKELAAMTASKESAKAKFERAEKERDSLMESNIRLLKQIGEKDEMNAMSLSTILHLKSMTEKLMEERDNLEQQVKSASQLALAARLATNAKERVSDEVLKEKNAVDDRLAELVRQYQVTQIELKRVSAEWSEASGRMAVTESELANALKRSDELVTESEQKRQEIRKLVDLVNKAERETREANEKLASAIKSGVADAGDSGTGVASGGTSSFSVDQLKTQISVLKSRLACPVCHYRDKECIILRCRHMHCKQCVDERISNRSRKCPTCNVKFSENEVGDIWLN